ncbi:MAG: hypothetical protein KJO42_04400 [Silicimonas sp.]|nr:hypothetical protein [Silicimonas sp.]RZV98804.1 MAG: hypothetical protein EX266_16285 [Paracoccaceae bacterium]MBT8424824.1 hypothetical protein [Silicimonas sp.]NND19658.1 hypothetical protein [Silicimonas sp.]NNL35471.1 hypothetical protein [Silicimonas sp.]
MINGLIAGLTAEARIVARRTGATIAGVLLILVGVIAATAAGWVAVAEARGPMAAWLVVSAVYVLLGVICLLIARRRPRVRPLAAATRPGIAAPKRAATTNPVLGIAAIVEAFALGVASGMRHKGR